MKQMQISSEVEDKGTAEDSNVCKDLKAIADQPAVLSYLPVTFPQAVDQDHGGLFN